MTMADYFQDYSDQDLGFALPQIHKLGIFEYLWRGAPTPLGALVAPIKQPENSRAPSSSIIVVIHLFLFPLFCILTTFPYIWSSCCRHSGISADKAGILASTLLSHSSTSERNLEGVAHYWSGLIAR
ncbi:hypothetical protein BDW67DRAFT_140222 [Aspergillus spinulosporus]